MNYSSFRLNWVKLLLCNLIIIVGGMSAYIGLLRDENIFVIGFFITIYAILLLKVMFSDSFIVEVKS